ncbi:MAG: DUF3806 domain-containing protein [Pseudomonadota bacterium]|nr:DUF3806 domain-containing protein [Pseudomonadota bacterium]
MVSQLSISERVSQPHKVLFFGLAKRLGQSVMILALSFGSALLCHAQGADFEVLIKPLTAIDRQFMTEQRGRVAALANRLGRGLTGNVDRDLDTLQRILDDRMVPTGDTLTLQAMGLVFGDLLGDRLGMQWVVYRDRQGRSRALRYRNRDVFLFPMTMISRRQEAGSNRRLRPLFDDTVAETRPLLPGGKWFQ